jgi:hypothetical protein
MQFTACVYLFYLFLGSLLHGDQGGGKRRRGGGGLAARVAGGRCFFSVSDMCVSDVELCSSRQ